MQNLSYPFVNGQLKFKYKETSEKFIKCCILNLYNKLHSKDKRIIEYEEVSLNCINTTNDNEGIFSYYFIPIKWHFL